MVQTPVASFTKEVNPWLAKRPLKTNERLANHGLTSYSKRGHRLFCSLVCVKATAWITPLPLWWPITDTSHFLTSLQPLWWTMVYTIYLSVGRCCPTCNFSVSMFCKEFSTTLTRRLNHMQQATKMQRSCYLVLLLMIAKPGFKTAALCDLTYMTIMTSMPFIISNNRFILNLLQTRGTVIKVLCFLFILHELKEQSISPGMKEIFT